MAEYGSVEEIEREYSWPDIDALDFSVIPGQLEGWDGYPVKGGGSEPFLDYVNLRGRQQPYVDLFDNKEIVHHCLDMMFDFRHKYTELIYREIPKMVTFSYVAEDLGSQRSLLFSPSLIHEFFIPRMRRMIDLAHRHSVYVFFHSNGAIREVLPDMIEAGIDLLYSIQWRCAGMEREALNRDFGGRGGVPRGNGQPADSTLRHPRGGPEGGRREPRPPGMGPRLHSGALPQHPVPDPR